MKIHGVGDRCTVELYTASYTGKLLYNSRNGPIQQRFTVSRVCSAIQLYSARVYSRAIQDTAYTLYSPIRRPSGTKRNKLHSQPSPQPRPQSKRHVVKCLQLNGRHSRLKHIHQEAPGATSNDASTPCLCSSSREVHQQSNVPFARTFKADVHIPAADEQRLPVPCRGRGSLFRCQHPGRRTGPWLRPAVPLSSLHSFGRTRAVA